MPWRDKLFPASSSLKLLMWTAFAGILFGLAGFGEIAEDWLRTVRNSLHRHSASGDIVLVTIDDQSLREAGRWPWPRRLDAQLADRLTAAGAKRIYFDLIFETPSNKLDDGTLARSIERSGRVVLAVRGRTGPMGTVHPSSVPLATLRRGAVLASIGVRYNYQNAVWTVPPVMPLDGKPLPSFSASLANRTADFDSEFTPDYSIRPESIPTLSAGDVLGGRFDPAAVRGKQIVVGTASDAIGDQYFIPGIGKMAGAYVHIIGGETLKAGTPVELGWIPAFLLALSIASFAALRATGRRRNAMLGAGAGLLLAGPTLLETRLINAEIMPALFVIAVVAAVLMWRTSKRREMIDPVSGLPNLNALRMNANGRNQALIVTRLLNHAEIIATLPAGSERQVVEQIVARLSVGAKDRVFYLGDGGIFAWFENSRLPFGNHIDALYALFRNPLRVGGQLIDVSLSFGVEIGSGRSIANRLGSALVAAEEAAHDGLKWKFHDPDSLQDASWKLSILSQLDAAIDKGEVWVAYQPKLDLASGRIIGAEALARWTHPDKGPIAASEFVAAAEQHDRIGKLTDFILDKAISAGASINRSGPAFDIAVNLSARMLGQRNLTMRIAALLAKYGMKANCLTLELTETAALEGSGEALDMLKRLREMGVKISIDDYGTGLSTLEYLKKIPANEIKIDQSFVKGMCDNRSDRVMVQSTIALAHSLGRKVVAEGVEQRPILDALIEMKCDIAQGFIIGRPMSLDSLAKRLASRAKRSVA